MLELVARLGALVALEVALFVDDVVGAARSNPRDGRSRVDGDTVGSGLVLTHPIAVVRPVGTLIDRVLRADGHRRYAVVRTATAGQ